jgi:hypothetical protein
MYLCVCVWQGLSTKPALPPACFSPRSFSNSQQDLELHAKKVHSRLTFQGMNLAQLVSLEVGQRGLDDPMNFKGPDFGKGRTCKLHGQSSFFIQKTIFPGYTRFVTPRWILWRDLHNAHVPVMTLHFQVKDDDDDYDASSVATEKTWSYSPLVPLGKSLSWAMRVWVNHWQSQIQIQWPVPFVSRVV